MRWALSSTFALVLALVVGCDGRGSLDIRWTVAGEEPTEDVQICSSRGLDVIQVSVTDAGGATNSEESFFPCREGRGRTGGLTPRTVDVMVRGLTPGFEPLVEADPILDLEIRDDETTQATIDIPSPEPCADLLDNDGDGLIDEEDC